MKSALLKSRAIDRWIALGRNAQRKDFISKHIPKNSIGAELGVYKGHFSELLIALVDPQELHLIDTWFDLEAEWDWAGGNRCTVNAVISILKRLKKPLKSGQVRLRIGDDREVLKSYPNQYFDWVYIDSSHQYEHTKQELNLVHAKLKPNGIASGDDWRPDPTHKHHGVCRAVREALDSKQFHLLEVDEANLQWAIRKTN